MAIWDVIISRLTIPKIMIFNKCLVIGEVYVVANFLFFVSKIWRNNILRNPNVQYDNTLRDPPPLNFLKGDFTQNYGRKYTFSFKFRNGKKGTCTKRESLELFNDNDFYSQYIFWIQKLYRLRTIFKNLVVCNLFLPWTTECKHNFYIHSNRFSFKWNIKYSMIQKK